MSTTHARTAAHPRRRSARGGAGQASLVALSLAATGALAVVAAPAATAATVDTSASYVLVNRNSGKALDVYNLATTDGARITQWSRNDGAQQQWQFVDSGDGYYRLTVRALRQGPRRLQPVHRRRRRGGAVDRHQRHQPAVAAAGHHRRLRHADQPQQRQGARGPERLHRRRRRTSCSTAAGAAPTSSGSSSASAAAPRPPTGTFTNPVVWQDFADGDIIRVGDAYYYSASTMHYSPGRADPALVRPGELGVRGALGAAARLRRRRLRPDRRPQVRQGHLGVDARLPHEQQHLLLARLHRVQPHVRLHRRPPSTARGPRRRGSTAATTTPAC